MAFNGERITVSNTAIGITAGENVTDGGVPARSAMISVEGAPIRFRIDGVDPTGSNGHLLVQGEFFLLEGEGAVGALKMIRSGSTDASVQITYQR